MMIGCVLLFLCVCTKAQEYVSLTAQQLRIDSLLPVYTYQKQLGSHYADSVWHVSIEYPLFIDMSPADVKRYRQISDEPLPAWPEVSQSVEVARKQGVLEVSFVPLVFRNGKYQKLVFFKLNVTAIPVARTRATRTASDRYADHSVLQSGTWAKISVPKTGFYQLTDALIKKAGFSDPSKVKLYGYGGALQPEKLTGDYLADTDDLEEVPTCVIDGRRLFYGVGPVNWETAATTTRTRNPYANAGCYFLTESEDEPLSISHEDFVATHYPTANDYHDLYEVDDFAWYHGGRNLFDKTLFSIGSPRSYTLCANGDTGTLSVALTYDGSISATIAVNDSVIGSVTRKVSLDSYTEAEENIINYDLTNLKAGENTVTITQTSGANLRLDYLSLTLATPKTMTDLQASDLPVPDYHYQIMNQDHHADEAVDMVIIIPTNQQVLSEAERIKAWHEEHDGLRVRIVPADELYNEFSSGTPDATAYRRYMKMLYDRADTDKDQPSYLLLFGDGAWDNRMLCADWDDYNPDDFLLCFESENSFSHVSCYVSDDFFCLLDDEEVIQEGSSYKGKPDVAVGRYPARTLDQAKVLVDKTLSYAANEFAGSWQNVICMMGDDGNGNSHMITADRVATLIENNYPGYQVKKIYWDAYQRVSSATGYSYPEATRQIKQQMADGALFMNYNGHGAPYAFSHELVMKLADFETSTTTRLPLWLTASCDIMPFDGQEDNIGETVMLSQKGGGVAFFGTTRTVYANYNEAMNLAFTGYVLTPGYTIGEAARQAKCDLVSTGRDTSPNKLQYSLLGDPALPLACPKSQVVVDSINGQPVGSDITLGAGSIAKVTGHVVRGKEVATDFHGIVAATVRDAEETIVCKLNDTSSQGAETPFVYLDRTKTLYQGSDSVSQGVFHFTFAVPKDISYTDGSGLMTLYAVDNDKTETAHGQTDGFYLTDSEIATNDSIGPSIFCYLNSRSFSNGDKVNTTPYFFAELYDESGINASGSSIGHDLELVIDGETSQTYNLNDYFTFNFGDYRSGTVSFSIPTLSYGSHSLQFRAWDVLNNSSVSRLSFVVSDDVSSGNLNVVCTKNPAWDRTSFIITQSMTSTEMDVLMEVFDVAGRQLYKRTVKGATTNGSFVLNWDINLSGGSHLQTGVYLCRITVGDTSKTVKLVIIKQ
jgi:hypothetical protein